MVTLQRMNLAKLMCIFLIVFLLVVSANGIGLSGEQPSTGSSNNELYFTLLHTNDEHSSLIPHSPAVDYDPQSENPTIGGYARLATVVNKIREEKKAVNEEVLLVSAGDFIGGTAFSWLVPQGQAVELEIKHKLGYDAVIIGNHEYDYGTDVLAQYLRAAGYPQAHEKTPVLATNILIGSEYDLVKEELYREYHIVELDNGLKIGFFGLIGEDAVSVAYDTDPVVFEILNEAAERAVKYLQGEDVDIIIAISHSGVDEDIELARQVDGIDVIVGGHCHTALFQPVREGNTYIVQAGSYLEYLGMVELAYNPDTAELRLRNEEEGNEYLKRLDSSIECNAEMKELIEGFTIELNKLVSKVTQGKFEDIMDIVVKSDFSLSHMPPLQETTFGNFTSDAMRFIAWERTGKKVDVAVQANGNIRGSLIPGTMEYSKGKVSFYDLTSLISLGYGYDGYAGYPIVSFYLTGEEIRRVLEVAVLLSETMGNTYFLHFSGLRYDYNPNDAVLVNVPVLDLPVPSTRAVKKAELYRGDGIQTTEGSEYESLEWGDARLYHVVTDSNILSFLPLAGQVLPQLDIVPKDQDGRIIPPEDFHQLVIRNNGEELKVWQAVVEYAASHTRDDEGYSVMPDYYSHIAARINPVRTIPLIVWPVLLLVIIAGLTVLLIRRRRIKRTKHSSNQSVK